MIGTDIAIDLGTSRFKVYLDGKGIVISEPSIIAVDNLTEEVIAVGSDAYNMLGRILRAHHRVPAPEKRRHLGLLHGRAAHQLLL